MTNDGSVTSTTAFRIEQERWRGSGVVISLFGDADLHAAPELRNRLFGTIQEGATDVVVDLTGVTFLDSMALGILLGARKRLLARNRQLRLVVRQPEILRILEITRLDRALPLYATRDDAIAGLGSSAGGLGRAERRVDRFVDRKHRVERRNLEHSSKPGIGGHE